MEDTSASEQIDEIVKLYGGWKGRLISQVRTVIKQVDPDVVEEVKWKMRTRPEGLPVWSHDGILCMVETFKNDQKIVFPKGAYMTELQKHFNARLGSKTDRAIEFHEGDVIDEAVLETLIAEAVKLNAVKAGKK